MGDHFFMTGRQLMFSGGAVVGAMVLRCRNKFYRRHGKQGKNERHHDYPATIV